MEDIKIDKGIPVPGPRYRWPFAKMEVGDSFTVGKGAATDLRNGASRWKARHPGWEYLTRKEGDRVRFWRTA